MTSFTPDDFKQMQQYFFTGAAASYSFRKEQLQVLKKAVQKYELLIMDALFKDLHKSKEEAFATETGFVIAEISHAIKNLRLWMKKTPVKTPLFLFPSSSAIIREPLGVCLIVAPWNYPFHLLIAPLVGALAAGNCAVLKPSEMAPHTSAVVNEMVTEFFNKRYISVVEGDGSLIVPQLMHENRFDHIFFTGSIPVGRKIAKMAAEKLVSVTLELGGKSPCIVDEDANIKVAAKRIVWGKFTNAGQTCVAPDYLLVHRSKKDELIKEMQNCIRKFYGEDARQSPDYGRIINDGRFNKLKTYLNEGSVITGGNVNDAERYIAPTLLQNINKDAAVMKEEIFGPVLPVITFTSKEEALAIIQQTPHPLSFYYFGNNRKSENYFIKNMHFGGGCINNTLVHLATPELPFGGVGNSGVGAYHGKFSFDTFSRVKAIVKTATWFDPWVKYPPYKGKLKFLRWLFR